MFKLTAKYTYGHYCSFVYCIFPLVRFENSSKYRNLKNGRGASPKRKRPGRELKLRMTPAIKIHTIAVCYDTIGLQIAKLVA